MIRGDTAELPVISGISSTQHFKRQLEDFCQLERVSPDEARRLDKTIDERICHAHGGNVIFSPNGYKVPVSANLGNGKTATMLILFDEPAPGKRIKLKILSAQMVRQ